jgi:dTDP-4-dehydrorhamnose 3,5-epimerase-like enzyme
LVTIPTGIINGYKCIGTEKCVVANCSDLPYQDGEMLRYDPFGNKVDYKWDIEMK